MVWKCRENEKKKVLWKCYNMEKKMFVVSFRESLFLRLALFFFPKFIFFYKIGCLCEGMLQMKEKMCLRWSEKVRGKCQV